MLAPRAVCALSMGIARTTGLDSAAKEWGSKEVPCILTGGALVLLPVAPKKKNPHFVALAKLAVKARMKKLTPEQRSEYARLAGRARWATLSDEERRRLAARGGAASKGVPKTRRREQ